MASLKDQHEITPEMYDERVRAFFDDQMPDPLVVDADQLKTDLQNASSPDAALLLTGSPVDHKNNNDLQYTIVPFPEPTPVPIRIFYSKALFLELLDTLNADTVAFSKATGRESAGDIIFQLRKGTTVVYCGDVSFQWP